ncbi:hypothetical protein NFI95_07320 [Acetobacteraceae bacterium KSS8]|uniref:Uncharacterized protein n=1 Tax=Endosaccharibacter trunci TaxID=2812733 RepID=A0ABT1W5V2_9PROT|nr:hypothetical protein [Acetobacteraceae bacterium KSS8]
MPTRKQMPMLVVVAILFWAVATASIRWVPGSLTGPLRGGVLFVTSVPICWGCIRLVRWLARLRPDQVLAATTLVVGVATLIDAAVLRWAPFLYGTDEHVLRLGASWLLWGYGVTLLLALLKGRAAPAARSGIVLPVA